MAGRGFGEPKTVIALRDNPSRTNERLVHAAQGLDVVETTRERPVKDADLYIQAGFQISPCLEDAMERGIPFLILENGCWHGPDKIQTYTIGYNGLNGCSFMPKVPPLERPKPDLRPMKPRDSGRTTIFGQLPGDKSLRGLDMAKWVRETCISHPDATFRPHPYTVPSWEQRALEPFQDCLDATSLAITYSSTVGAECLIQGIETVAEHPGSFAYPFEGDREAWLHWLSWRHWTFDEEFDWKWCLSGYEEARERAQRGLYDNCNNGRPQPHQR
ncbi:MAG: hypothetical protein ACYSW8_32895 [Planctomycetota bacterium]|jgi:hypothetical protein